jgi:Xaa-Pro aminopeptidase
MKGSDMDILARRRLWARGMDYGHGTGHGVGYYLNVHEGPKGISKYSYQAFQPGNIVSNGFDL